MKADKQKLLLSLEDVCSIIKVCEDSRVTVLKFGDLHVEFGPKSPKLASEAVLTPEEATEIASTQKKEADKSHVAEEIAFRERQLSEALLMDPLLAEQLLTQGELTNSGEADDDEA